MDRSTTRVPSARIIRLGGRVSCFVVTALLSCVANAPAQTSTGGIRGVVNDTTGAVLAGVTVEAASPARIGGAAVEVTNEQGLYHFENLPRQQTHSTVAEGSVSD